MLNYAPIPAPCSSCLAEGRAAPAGGVYRRQALCLLCAIHETVAHYSTMPKWDAEVPASYGSGTRNRGAITGVPVWMGNRCVASVDFITGGGARVTLHACTIGDDGRAYHDEVNGCTFNVSGKGLRAEMLAAFHACI